jgi:uncharacterized protein
VIRNLLLTGGPGPGHDFPALARAIAAIVSSDPNAEGCTPPNRPDIETTIVSDPTEAFALLREGWSSGEPFSLFTVNALRWLMGAERYASQRDAFAFALAPTDLDSVDELLARGGGLLAVHTAAICFDADERWHRMLGASWNWDRSYHPPAAQLNITVTPEGTDHALTCETPSFELRDEMYIDLNVDDDVVPLLTASTGFAADVQRAPVLWARNYNGGRVVTDLLGHDVVSLTQQQHRTVLRNAAVWAACGDQNA